MLSPRIQLAVYIYMIYIYIYIYDIYQSVYIPGDCPFYVTV